MVYVAISGLHVTYLYCFVLETTGTDMQVTVHVVDKYTSLRQTITAGSFDTDSPWVVFCSMSGGFLTSIV